LGSQLLPCNAGEDEEEMADDEVAAVAKDEDDDAGEEESSGQTLDSPVTAYMHYYIFQTRRNHAPVHGLHK